MVKRKVVHNNRRKERNDKGEGKKGTEEETYFLLSDF